MKVLPSWNIKTCLATVVKLYSYLTIIMFSYYTLFYKIENKMACLCAKKFVTRGMHVSYTDFYKNSIAQTFIINLLCTIYIFLISWLLINF